MKRILANDKAFYLSALAITLPIAMQNLIASSLNMFDTVLIGGLGKEAIAAVGLSNQVFFLYNLITFGICSGAAIFTAQFWGEKDVKNVRRTLGLAISANLAVALLFCLTGFLLPGPILRIFTADPRVIALGIRFLRIISFSYFFFGVTFAYAFTLRGVGQPVYPMLTSFAAFGLNTILNYLLIYGHAGLPRLGVAGSACATVIARAVECFGILAIVYGLRLVPAAKARELFTISASFARRVLRTALPVVLNESLWAFGTIMYMIVYAHMGTGVVAAYNIFSTIDKLAMVLFFGLAQACAIMVGQKIGARREETAFIYAKTFSVLGPGLGVVIGAVLLAVKGSLLTLFDVPGQVIMLAGLFITVYAITIPVRIFNLINIIGTLRSGGDTRFSLFLDTAALWLLAVPLAFLAGLVWRLPPIYVYLMATTEEVIKFSLGLWRLLSGKWINNLVAGIGDEKERGEADLAVPGV